MEEDLARFGVHPSGEQSPVEADASGMGVVVDSFSGSVRVEFDHEAALAPPGQLPFFIDFLKTAGLFEAFVADCPLRYTSPNAPKGQRTASAYTFGAICPRDGKGAALVMPRCDTEAMNLHLAEIATQIAPGAHAALLVDQAGWHVSQQLTVPPNITLIPLPAKCPELNPQENVWQFMRETGSQTGSSNPSTTSSITVATLGTSSSISPGGSCPSAYETGSMPHYH